MSRIGRGAIRKRGKTWQIDYTAPAFGEPEGKRIRQTFKTQAEAISELAKRVSLKAEKRYLDVKLECTTRLGELIAKYDENFRTQKSFKSWKKRCLKNIKAYFGEDTLLSAIKYRDVETYRNSLKQKLTYKGTERKPASINREMSCLHHLFMKAAEWEYIEQNPFDRGTSLQMKENNERTRFLTKEEKERLIEVSPPHLRNIVVCALNTGMRRGEVLSLKWEQIRNGFIYLQETKTNESRQIPVNATLRALFASMSKQRDTGSKKGEYVFTYKHRDVNRENKMRSLQKNNVVTLAIDNDDMMRNLKHSFTTALKRAGIEDCTFHTLRHYAESRTMPSGDLNPQ